MERYNLPQLTNVKHGSFKRKNSTPPRFTDVANDNYKSNKVRFESLGVILESNLLFDYFDTDLLLATTDEKDFENLIVEGFKNFNDKVKTEFVSGLSEDELIIFERLFIRLLSEIDFHIRIFFENRKIEHIEAIIANVSTISNNIHLFFEYPNIISIVDTYKRFSNLLNTVFLCNSF